MDDKSRQRALLRIHYFDTVLRYMPENVKSKHAKEQTALLADIMPFFATMQQRVQLLHDTKQDELVKAHGLASQMDLAFYIALAYTEWRSKNANASQVF